MHSPLSLRASLRVAEIRFAELRFDWTRLDKTGQDQDEARKKHCSPFLPMSSLALELVSGLAHAVRARVMRVALCYEYANNISLYIIYIYIYTEVYTNMHTCKSIAQRRLGCLAHATGEVHKPALPAATWVHHMPSCMRSYCIMSCYNKPSVKFTSYVYIISYLLVAFLGQRCLRHMRRELDEEGLRQKSRAEHFDGYGELVAV